MKFWILMLTICLVLVMGPVEARRLGGGKSFGQQSSRVTQRPQSPAQGAAPTSPAQGSPAVQPASPKRPWGAMLGGLAAGFGLAWLASSLGMGGMGQLLMFALLALVVMMLVGWFVRSRQRTLQTSTFAPNAANTTSAAISTPDIYRPDSVGNDASARPWEYNSTALASTANATSTSGSIIGSGLSGSQTWGIPADFDTEGFLQSAKTNFVSLQAAWDRSDMTSLHAMMTDAMLKEIQAQLAERKGTTGTTTNVTEVVTIDARLLGIEDLGDDYMASVEFSGMIREEPSSVPSPFREVWNMIKLKNGQTGWLVAGVQALQ